MNQNRLVPAKRPLQSPVKPRLRFREQDDLALLREVLSINPLQDPGLWATVHEHMVIITTKKNSIKTLRDHLLLLIQQWLEKMKDLKDRSGIEESYSEKDQLCHQINEMMAENARLKCNKRSEKQVNLGRIAREQFSQEAVQLAGQEAVENEGTYKMEIKNENNTALLLDHGYFCVTEVTPGENVIQNDIIITTSNDDINNSINNHFDFASSSHVKKNKENNQKRKIDEKRILQRVRARTRRTNTQKQGLEYLENYEKTQNELKKVELDQAQQKLDIEKEKLAIEKRRLELEEKKILLEEYEKKKVIELLEEKIKDERRERDQLLKLIERQEDIITSLLKNIK